MDTISTCCKFEEAADWLTQSESYNEGIQNSPDGLKCATFSLNWARLGYVTIATPEIKHSDLYIPHPVSI